VSADGVDPAARGIAIGLDLGGSSVKFAVLGLQGGERPELLSSGLHEIPASRAPDVVVEILATTGNRLCEQFGAPERIGVGLPGLHDPEDGTTRLLPNFPPEWVGFPLRTELEARLPWPVVLGNDARAFALAEATMGAAVGFRTAVCIVLGTGVGGGVVIDGELWRGQGTGGELGHQTVELDGPPCGCGNRGCVEAIAGSAALLRGAGRSSVRSLVLIGDHSALDQQCSTSAHLEELGLARGGDAGADPAECEGRLATHLPQGVVERTALEVGREHWGAVGGERCRLESHGGAVCQAESRDRHDAGGFCQVQRLDLGRARLAELGGEQTRGGAHPSMRLLSTQRRNFVSSTSLM